MLSRMEDTAGVLRRIVVLIDGVPAVLLSPGETRDVELPAGPHRVVAEMDWVCSPTAEIVLTPGQVVALRTSMPWSTLWRMILTPRRALVLEPVPG
jgi:hypothetical protein